MPLRVLDQPVRGRVDNPRSQQRARQDEHCRDGDGRGVREDREQLVRGDEPQQEKRGCPRHCDHGGRIALRNEADEYREQDKEGGDARVVPEQFHAASPNKRVRGASEAGRLAELCPFASETG